MAFAPATRKNARLRLAIAGTAGAGKTYSALLMAKEFGTRIAVLDSERGSASLYADLVPFDVQELEGKTPLDYIAAIKEAAELGYEVLVIDSYSHSWMGALELVDRKGGWVRGGKDVSPQVARLVDAILQYPGHVIATMRSKADYAIETVDGKARMRKLGMATVAREGTDYEFTVMLSVTTEGGLEVTKTRCSALSGNAYTRDDIPKIARTLKEWLTSGAAPSMREQVLERVRFAPDAESLQGVITWMKGLQPPLGAEDLAAVRAEYTARKAALTAPQEDGTLP